jgi:hypothetical protein
MLIALRHDSCCGGRPDNSSGKHVFVVQRSDDLLNELWVLIDPVCATRVTSCSGCE